MTDRLDDLRRRIDDVLQRQDGLATEQAKAHAEALELAVQRQGKVEDVAELEQQIQELALGLLDLCRQADDEARSPAPMLPTYHAYACQRWRLRSEWINGRGRWALLAWCNVLTIRLYETEEAAEKGQRLIDETGCGGGCWGRHEIIDLQPWARAPVGRRQPVVG